jgi:hypothetical protein
MIARDVFGACLVVLLVSLAAMQCISHCTTASSPPLHPATFPEIIKRIDND